VQRAAAQSTCGSFTCQTGHWCAAGQAIPCEAGTYNDQCGSSNPAACIVCPYGFTTAGSGATSASDCSVVGAPNFTCASGATCAGSQCCPQGSWCAAGMVFPCPAGTAQPSQGAWASFGCCTPCAENQYSPNPGASVCTVCPVHSSTLGRTGSDNSSACQCTTGYTMDAQGACVPIPAGDGGGANGSARCLRVLRVVPILLAVVVLGGLGFCWNRRRQAAKKALMPPTDGPAL
jgi:hypothetical protein